MQNIDLPEPKPEEIYPPCLNCNGTGITSDFGPIVILCSVCNGEGYIEPEEDEEIPY